MPLGSLETVGDRGVTAHETERHGRKIIEQAGFFVINERNVFIEEAHLSSRRERGVESCRLAVKLLGNARILCFSAQRLHRRGDRGQLVFAGKQLACRRKDSRLYLFGHTLRRGVEKPHAVHLVAEKFYAQRECAAVAAAVRTHDAH